VKRLLWPLVMVAVAVLASVVMAAEVGKIAGKAVDAASKEPIPSVNVTIVGTTAGASTNADGEFFILNVPVGTYEVRVSSLGYETQNITGVQVLADQTFELNLQLKETVLQGQEVNVVAERDVIKRDVSNTVRSVTAQELNALPVTTYQQALAATAGVVGQGNNLHFRGGRNTEVLYLVDGMEVKDPQFATRSLNISEDAVGEMQVLTAGFNAEFGEAQSAVVNLVVREGDPQYHGRVEHMMDGGTPNNGHYQDYDYTTGTLSGPEPITQQLLPRLGMKIPGNMNFFASGTAWGRNTNENGVWINTDRWYRHQLTNIFGLDARKNQAFTNSNLKLTYNPTPKYKIGLSWNQAQTWANPYSWRMSRRFPDDFTQEEQSLGTHALSQIQGFTSNATDYANIYGKDDDHDGRVDEEALNWQDDDGDGLIDEDLQPYNFNGNDNTRTDVIRDQQFGLMFDHNVNQKTFYTIRLSGYSADRQRAGANKPYREYGQASEAFVDLPDGQGKYNHRYDLGEPFTDVNGNGMWDFNNPDNFYPAVNGFAIMGDGLSGITSQLVPDWAHFTSQTFTFKGDLTSQVTPRHMLKSGLEFNYYNTSSEDRPYTALNSSGIYTDVYRYYPTSGAAYVQDKMEYRDIIVNAGLRADYWKIGGNRIEDPLFRVTGNDNYVDYEPPKKNGELYVSPRLGIAYSVTANDVFHFNYGYFYQRAQQDYYFTAVNQIQTGGTPVIGNPGLKPMKTIAYELGVRHQFAGDFLLDVSTYYKDIKNWVNTAAQNQLFYDLYRRLIVGSNAAIYYNADYAAVRGIELNLTKDYGSHLSGRLTYTLSWATGKNSYDLGSQVTRSNYLDPKRETPLAWDRRHQFVFNLGYNTPLEGKPFTEKWFKSGWSANVLSQALSGLPYTPTYGNGTDVFGQEFAKNTPWTYSTDVNLSRTFGSGPVKWRAMLEVRNLFDVTNVLGWDINPNTIDTYLNGEPGYVNDISSPNYGQNPKSGPNPDAWDVRRLVRFGLALEF
jgi:outer membrane receptor protein involved in Fe transport